MSKQPKYKVGDKVRIVSNPEPGIDAIQEMVGNVYSILSHDPNSHSEEYGISPGKGSTAWWFGEENLAPVKKTLRDMQPGDVVIDVSGEAPSTVQLILPDGFIHYDKKSKKMFTTPFSYAEKYYWKLKDTNPPEIITINNKTYRKEDVIERLVGLEEL